MKRFKALCALVICLLLFIVCSITASAGNIGDINNDGIHSTEDARIILLFDAGIKKPTSAEEGIADVNHDGYITTKDAAEALRIASGITKAPNHIYTEWKVIQQPTCTQNGKASSFCLFCDQYFYKVLYATGHKVVGQTCTQDGSCQNCGQVFKATGHKVVGQTCTTDGSCQNCGQVFKATGHNFVNGVCSVCKYSTLKPYIRYNSKTINFNVTPTTVKSLLGNPQDTLTDKIALGNVTVYVYCSNYSNLGIFTFINNKLTQFYSNNKYTSVSDKGSTFSLSKATVSEFYYTIGNINIETYIDNHASKGAYTYSYLASVGEKYTFEKTSVYTTHQKLVFHLTNGCRALNGVSPLTYCTTAQKAAYKHSLDMATNNYFSHTSLNGNDVVDRLDAVGINNWYACGENIAAGLRDPYVLTEAWYNSTGHRSNMLNKNFENLGVGIAYGPNSGYKYYSTQNFYA